MLRLLLLPMLALIASCGFTPLYGQKSRSFDGQPSAMRPDATLPGSALLTQAIEVAPIADEVGQRVRLELQKRLTPRGAVVEPRYRLEVILREHEAAIAVGRNTNAKLAQFTLEARYHLIDLAAQTNIFSSTARSLASYEIPATTAGAYEVVIGRADARRRTARLIAQEVNRRLVIFFATAGAGASCVRINCGATQSSGAAEVDAADRPVAVSSAWQPA